jgi:hypothetical protein
MLWLAMHELGCRDTSLTIYINSKFDTLLHCEHNSSLGLGNAAQWPRAPLTNLQHGEQQSDEHT